MDELTNKIVDILTPPRRTTYSTIPAAPVGETSEQWLARILAQRAARERRIAAGREQPDWDEIRKIEAESADL